jgi:hypothetical protein
MKTAQVSPLVFFICLGLTCINEVSAQPTQKLAIDTGHIVNIVYPPLTEREGKGLRIPVPPSEHPRLFFRRSDIPALKAKAHHTLMKQCWDRILKSAELYTDGRLKITEEKQNLDNGIRDAIEAKALLYSFSGDETIGRAAVDALLNFYATLKIDLTRHDICRIVGRAILTGSMVYDWCYDLLSENEKQLVIARMETLAVTGLELEWPRLVQGSVTGHGSEAQLARDMLSCGVATYDEKPEIYNLAAGRIIAEFVPARQFFYPASYHHQGSSYGGYRFLWDMWATLIFDRMGYPQVFGPHEVKVPYRFIYLRRPDGQLLRDGDDFIECQVPFGTYWQTGGDAFAGSYFDDPLLIGEAIKQQKIGVTSDYIFDYLFFDTSVAARMDKTALPLTKYFSEPLGAMVARTGFDEGITSRAVVAEMKIGVKNFANHQHLDAGSFQLYYKGPLAAESGIYEGGKGAYGSEHFKNYYQRSIAHNTMLVHDPAEKFTWQGREVANDGGQLFPNGGREPVNLEMLLTNDYETGEVLAFAFGPDSLKPAYSYLKGELAKAYSSKVKSLQRSFVFLNMHNEKVPATLIVFDRVAASDDKFRKYWLLHTVEEPMISGNTTIVARQQKGYNGKMINTTLLPEGKNLSIKKVGGPGKEFSVFGQNFDQTFSHPGRNSSDSAMWRIEVSPSHSQSVDQFLNVMQVMDNDAQQHALAVQKLDAGRLTGLAVADRVVFFSKDGQVVNDEIKISIKGSERYKVLLTDISKGEWKVQSLTKKENPVRLITSNADVLYFEAEKGNYLISPVR